MKAVVLGIAAMIAISVVAWAVLGTQVTATDEAYTSPNNTVRLD